jgi:MFS-type transporter involved in bile tolerance (Atg22 family)
MSNLTSSIVRGFGFTLGRAAATSVLTPSKQVVNDPKEIECWSHRGYEEGDVETITEYEYTRKYIKWYEWLFILSMPIFNCILTFRYFYYVFMKKNHVYFYDMVWNTYTVSDGRTKTGTREIKKLIPVLGKVTEYPPYKRNKVESLIALGISVFYLLLIFLVVKLG